MCDGDGAQQWSYTYEDKNNRVISVYGDSFTF